MKVAVSSILLSLLWNVQFASAIFVCRGSSNRCGNAFLGLFQGFTMCKDGVESCILFPFFAILRGSRCGPCDIQVCSEQATYTVSTATEYDTLVFPALLGEAGVIWDVAFSSKFTKFRFNLAYSSSTENATLAGLVANISSQEANISSGIDVRFVISDQIRSSQCTNAPTVRVTIPRSVQAICIGDVCRPILCSLGSEFVARRSNSLEDISFVPSNTKLFFNGTDCRITPPADWNDYVNSTLNQNTTSSRTDFWFYQDPDGDGASNIVEYYGIPIGSFFADVIVGSNKSFPTNPLDPDSDNDLFLDGYELLYGQDPNNFTSVTIDTDGDGLTNFQEQAFRTNPFMFDTDSDGDDDMTELFNGTNPMDDTENLGNRTRRRLNDADAPCIYPPALVTLTVGDPSGSASERYTMTVGPIEHSAPNFGRLSSATYPFTKGNFRVTVRHRDSNLQSPDYDYFAGITWAPSIYFDFNLTDPQRLLGSHSESSYDATLGKSAIFSITEKSSICGYTTCKECRSDKFCLWDVPTKTCKKECFFKYKPAPQACPCEKCKVWAAKEFEKLRENDWIQNLPRCPCSVSFAGLDYDDYVPTDWGVDDHCNPENPAGCRKNHPSAKGCIRQYTGGYGNQCCYASSGAYIATGAGAGTPDNAFGQYDPFHYFNDFVPYEFCCLECEISQVCNLYIGGEGVERGARQDTRGCL